jgi:hypothetical protein
MCSQAVDTSALVVHTSAQGLAWIGQDRARGAWTRVLCTWITARAARLSAQHTTRRRSAPRWPSLLLQSGTRALPSRLSLLASPCTPDQTAVPSVRNRHRCGRAWRHSWQRSMTRLEERHALPVKRPSGGAGLRACAGSLDRWIAAAGLRITGAGRSCKRHNRQSDRSEGSSQEAGQPAGARQDPPEHLVGLPTTDGRIPPGPESNDPRPGSKQT